MKDSAKTVMVIEDDRECLEAVTDVLRHHGYAVVPVKNGLEALRHLETNPPPDLILLDLMMPVMDGWQFLTEQKSRTSLARIPVALLSGERDLARRASELSLAGYIQKPVKLHELLSMVRKLSSPPS
jgi:two-component system chemotaxis response regulator CheY